MYSEKQELRIKIKLGGFSVDKLKIDNVQTEINGCWVMARPVSYRSILSRLRLCWDVLKYKADVIYWYKQ